MLCLENKVDTDTNQMDVGNYKGQRYISIEGMITNLLFSKDSGHFKLMGMNAATGEPLLFI